MTLTDLIKQAAPLNIKNKKCVMILAPHPDDESLGCGGLISILGKQKIKVFVTFITDGSLSHPNSKKYPSDKLATLRKAEAIAALNELGVDETCIFFMNKKDRALPCYNEACFFENCEDLKHIIAACKPDLIFVTYEKDPHPDHRATWQMLMQIKRQKTEQFSILEYIIWLYNLGESKDLPEQNAEWLYADITACLHKKQKAIAKHVSQTTRLIDDDPDGFILTPDVLQHFYTTKEFFLNRNL